MNKKLERQYRRAWRRYRDAAERYWDLLDPSKESTMGAIIGAVERVQRRANRLVDVYDKLNGRTE